MELDGLIEDELAAASAMSESVASNKGLSKKLAQVVEACLDAVRTGGRVVFAGNGGSYAQAQHFAAELVGRFRLERPSIPSLALGLNGSTLTAVTNDISYVEAFKREAAAVLRREDVLIVLSTSGNSDNMVAIARDHVQRGGITWAWTGSRGGALRQECPGLRAPASDAARVQEAHLAFGHTLCHAIEQEIAG